MLRFFLSVFLIGSFSLVEAEEIMELDIIPYEKLIQEDTKTLLALKRALHEKGIVGVRGVYGFKEKYEKFIATAKEFNELPEAIKESYKPNRELGETFLGYETGKEKFQQLDGQWTTDHLKTFYYAIIPDNNRNKWPIELDLKNPFEDLGQLMMATGKEIMYKIGVLGDPTGLYLEDDACTGNMLYYRKSEYNKNPYWCSPHFDHGLFTAILPAVYFANGEQIKEPAEAGLFVRTSKKSPFKKVVADDLNVMMFQVGEFGQLVKDDNICATEHFVHKAFRDVERYTFAVFYNAPMDMPIHSKSILTKDSRYEEQMGKAFTYRDWHEASFKKYLVNIDNTEVK